MRKRLVFGASALALLIGASAAQAQSVGVSVGYGSPGYYGYDTGWRWGPTYPPYTWGGPSYVGSYYAPTYAPAYSYGPGGHVYGYDEASGQPIVTRRVVVTTAAPAPVTTTVAVPVTSSVPVAATPVAATVPAYDDVVATGSISAGRDIQPPTVVRARELTNRVPRAVQRRALAESRPITTRRSMQY
jgi:hypothetical protein